MSSDPKRPVLFVTGGSRGIGAALVAQAVDAGYDVAFTFVAREDAARAVADEARSRGARVIVERCDVRDPQAVDDVADRVLDELGRVDAVVANAGVSLNGLAYAVTDDDWKTVIDTNLTGTFHVCRAFLPALVSQRAGAIVMISSIIAGGGTGQAAYAASKAGITGLAKTLAKEYGKKGVRTNVVAAGYFDTDMTRDTMDPATHRFAMDFCPQGRLGTLEELAGTVLFLCGPDAGYVNGAVVPVTGGLDWAP
jgi:3-oxoacyl-[acyl-carrier protein] reductase